MSPARRRAATARAGSSRNGPPGASSVQKRLDLQRAAFDPRGHASEKCDPIGNVESSRLVIELLDARPAVSIHRPAPFRSSRRSHDFANCQSRWTVSGDTSRASAVSCTLNPPKKRSSTTRLFRLSISQRLQGKVERDQVGRAVDRHLRRVIERRQWRPPPPRFRYRFDRATSTRMRRMSRAESQRSVPGRATRLRAANQAEVGLVEQRRRLQAVSSALGGHECRASLCSSRCTSGTSCSNAVASPSAQAWSSIVTSGAATEGTESYPIQQGGVRHFDTSATALTVAPRPRSFRYEMATETRDTRG